MVFNSTSHEPLEGSKAIKEKATTTNSDPGLHKLSKTGDKIEDAAELSGLSTGWALLGVPGRRGMRVDVFDGAYPAKDGGLDLDRPLLCLSNEVIGALGTASHALEPKLQ